jgi:LEA14-like dessication related protein
MKFRLCVPALALFCLACATEGPQSEVRPPVQIENPPAAQISFDRFEFAAGDTGAVTLYFDLEAVNPRSEPAALALSNWNLTVHGRESGAGAVFFPGETERTLNAGSSARFPLRLELDARELPLTDVPSQEALPVELGVDLVFTYGAADGTGGLEAAGGARLTAPGAFPLIREPVFTITEVAVKQAELINTRFKVHIRIDNPNFFPVDLSALVYELYGNGRFWADGKAAAITHAPAGGTSEIEVLLMMNFLDMGRELLDQIVALRQVNCRFAGEAVVRTGLDYLPQFRTGFDRSGLSGVIE